MSNYSQIEILFDTIERVRSTYMPAYATTWLTVITTDLQSRINGSDLLQINLWEEMSEIPPHQVLSLCLPIDLAPVPPRVLAEMLAKRFSGQIDEVWYNGVKVVI